LGKIEKKGGEFLWPKTITLSLFGTKKNIVEFKGKGGIPFIFTYMHAVRPLQRPLLGRDNKCEDEHGSE